MLTLSPVRSVGSVCPPKAPPSYVESRARHKVYTRIGDRCRHHLTSWQHTPTAHFFSSVSAVWDDRGPRAIRDFSSLEMTAFDRHS